MLYWCFSDDLYNKIIGWCVEAYTFILESSYKIGQKIKTAAYFSEILEYAIR